MFTNDQGLTCGPGCIKQLMFIKWNFLQLPPGFRKVFFHNIMDKSAEVRLKSMRNTMLVRKSPFGHRKHKIPLNRKMLYATAPWSGESLATGLVLFEIY